MYRFGEISSLGRKSTINFPLPTVSGLLALSCLICCLYLHITINNLESYYQHEISQAILRDEKQVTKNEKVAEILKFLLAADNKKEAPTPSSELIGYTVGPKANLRSSASTDSEILMVLTGENKLVIEGEEGSFYKVTAPSGEKAFVAKSLVNVPTDIG